MRNLILILGDQLNLDSEALRDFDREQDAVWMAEVEEEATHVWCHKQRLAFFFSAMRHFRDALRERGFEVHYHELSNDRRRDRGRGFAEVIQQDARRTRPARMIVVLPGDYRVKECLSGAAERLGIALEVRSDNHFYCTPEEFAEHARGKKTLLLEHFYRYMRKRHRVLLENGGPVGGEWNFDHENREAFDRDGPGRITGPHAFRPDVLTRSVLEMVSRRYTDHPGNLEDFNLPVKRAQALTMLRDFVKRSLPLFGKYEDAMWTDEAFLYHSRLSAPLNVKLLNPRECVNKAVESLHAGKAPINSVEGFVRQLLGWREYTRGIYWLRMPEYAQRNSFHHQARLPELYWTGETDMACVAHAMQHVLRYGYTHHIERLMVLGNLALLLGVHPHAFHEWHMAMYVDAVDWVSLPNALGMSQHADGGLVGSKPYVSTGRYIQRMSNYCEGCRYDPDVETGENACPFTTLYWDFLERHSRQLGSNNRMRLQLKNVEHKRKSGALASICKQAEELKHSLDH